MTEFEIIEDGEYVLYTRHGECNKCGACCCRNIIGVEMSARIGKGGDKENDLSPWEGFSYADVRGVAWWWKFDIRDKLQERPCIHLCGGDNTCSIYGKDEFPLACEFFPVHPRDIEKFPECGYWFERENDRKT